MKLKALDCPKCGAPVSEMNVGKRVFKCDACGMTLVDEDAIEKVAERNWEYAPPPRFVWDNMYVTATSMLNMSTNSTAGTANTTGSISGEAAGYGLSGRIK